MPSAQTRQHDPTQLADAVRGGDRRTLARAITLVESSRGDHRELADALLEKVGGDSMAEVHEHFEATRAQQRIWPSS